MKTRIGLWILWLPVLVVSAQENDDMYFRSRDRQKAVTASAESYVSNYDNFKRQHFPEALTQPDGTTNPTDSYSARQLNPEFVSRSNAEQASEDEQNYFIQGYTPVTSATTGYYNNSSLNNSWNTNNWYAPGWYGPARFNNWYSPYYGFYDPWMNPFWGMSPGWNYGFNSYWGPWGSGWNFNLGYTWGNAWCPVMWGPSWSYWNQPYTPYYYSGYERTRANYGKRPSNNAAVAGDMRSRNSTNTPNQVVDNSSGRTRGNDEYYVRPSRRAAPANTSTDGSVNRSRNYSRDTYNTPSPQRNTYQPSRPSYTPSRSGSFNSGTRSSSPSSGSRSRGGN